MIGAFWNTRCLNKTDILNCVADFTKMDKLDFVGFQETKKFDFPNNILNLINKDMD
jgi:hypothetical protein